MESPYMNVVEAADYLGLSKSWLDKLRIDGKGPAHYRIGRQVRYRIEDLDAWAERFRKEVGA